MHRSASAARRRRSRCKRSAAPSRTSHDGDPAAPLSDFTATINWGDSSSSSGTVSGSGGSYTVAGSHTYASTGYFNVNVHVDDVGGSTADTTTPCTVLVFAFAPGGGSFVIGDQLERQRHRGHLLGRPVGEAELLERRRRAVVLQGLCQEPDHAHVRWTRLEHRPGQQLLASGGTAARLHGRDRRELGHQVRLADLRHDAAHRRRADGPGYAPNPGHAGTGPWSLRPAERTSESCHDT